MSVIELIAKEMDVLPLPLQQEVLDFVALLKSKKQTSIEEFDVLASSANRHGTGYFS